MSIPVTLLYGGLSALLLITLSTYVSAQRGKYKSYIGDAPPVELQRVIRAHGNATEYVPIGILMLLVLELSGLGSTALHVLGGGFLAGRVLHAAGTLTKTPLSTVGATINNIALVAMGGWATYLHFVK